MAQLQEMNKPIRKNPQKRNDRKKNSHMPNKSYQHSRKNPLINWNPWVSIYKWNRKSLLPVLQRPQTLPSDKRLGRETWACNDTAEHKIISDSQEATIFQVSPIYIQLSEQIPKLVFPIYIQLSEQMSKYSIISDFPCGPVVKTPHFLCN